MQKTNLMEKFFSQIETHSENNESSFTKWQKSNYENGKFYILSGNDEYVNTDFLISEAVRLAENQVKCGFITLRKTAFEVFARFMSIASGVKYYKFSIPKFMKDGERGKLQKSAELYPNIEIVDAEDYDIDYICKECERLKNEVNCKIVFIDSLNYICFEREMHEMQDLRPIDLKAICPPICLGIDDSGISIVASLSLGDVKRSSVPLERTARQNCDVFMTLEKTEDVHNELAERKDVYNFTWLPKDDFGMMIEIGYFPATGKFVLDFDDEIYDL